MSEYRNLRDAVWALAWEGVLDHIELLVALRLVEHWPRIFPGESTLVRWTRLSESSVRRALRRLEQEGIIRTLRNPGRGNGYEFLDNEGIPIKVGRLGQTPVPQTAAPVRETAPPVPQTGPTPVPQTAEADPDLKQTREAGKGSCVARRSRANLKTELPEDLVPNASCLTLARERGVDLEWEMPQFIDHHRKNASRFADWQAAIRTWIRNAKSFGVSARGLGGPRSRNSPVFEHLARRVQEEEEKERMGKQ